MSKTVKACGSARPYANCGKASDLLARIQVTDMNERLNPNVRRRDLLRTVVAGAGATAAAAIPIAVAARDPDTDKKQRARYQPNSPDIQNFYRVNRYPPPR